MTEYESFDYLKYVASNAKSFSGIIKSLESEIVWLKAMKKDGIKFDLQNISDGHISMFTNSPKLAKKYGFHKVESEEE